MKRNVLLISALMLIATIAEAVPPPKVTVNELDVKVVAATHRAGMLMTYGPDPWPRPPLRFAVSVIDRATGLPPQTPVTLTFTFLDDPAVTSSTAFIEDYFAYRDPRFLCKVPQPTTRQVTFTDAAYVAVDISIEINAEYTNFCSFFPGDYRFAVEATDANGRGGVAVGVIPITGPFGGNDITNNSNAF